MTDNVAGDPQRVIADLQRRLDELIAQQTATADVLKAVSRSTFDLQTVLETLIKSAVELCGANRGSIFLRDGDVFPLKAASSSTPEFLEYWAANPPRAGRGSATSRVIASGKIELIPDVLDDPDMEMPAGSLIKIRAALGVPMLRNNKVEGVLVLTRPEPGPFSKSQIDLVQTFADQAMIAIENTRLFNETKEALERQTATSEVLGIINSSPGDLKTVFEAMVEKARRLCDAESGHLALPDGDDFRTAAVSAMSPDLETMIRAVSYAPGRGTAVGRSLLERRAVQIADIAADSEHAARHAGNANLIRTILGVPLMREGEPIGAFGLSRSRVKPFTERQIELVETFAAQAVIAIENTRLFNETREALERQTATADVLKVIASSPSDVQPVFDAIASSAKALIRGFSATVSRIVGDKIHLVAFTPTNARADEALQASFPIPLAEFPPFESIGAGATVQFVDTEAEGVPVTNRDVARLRGYRSMLFTPLMNNGEPIGMISVTRTETGTFADHDVELLQTFADQAVIAIENTRLFNEVQARTRDLTEALSYQTGSGNVLRVIASSPADVAPVLEVIVESARELCEADDATVLLKDDDHLRFNAHSGPIPLNVDRWPIGPGWTAGLAFLDKKPVHVHDMLSEEGAKYPDARAMGQGTGATIHTVLSVPLVRGSESVGAILLRRAEIRPFSEKQIDLLSTFADQAVIAIQNANLFNETREALERQTATADILKVIASSPTDAQPVFEAIATRANSLVGGFSATVFHFIDGMAHLMAFTPTTPAADEILKSTFPSPVDSFAPFQMARDGDVTQVPDTETLTDEILEIAHARGFRSMLFAPLMNKGASIGLIAVTRLQPGTFSDHHVQLLRTFADQAVIAIENVRLFEEVQARTADLQELLQHQTAASDVLRVISRSPGELNPVFETILANATRICDAQFGLLVLYEDGGFRCTSTFNLPTAFAETFLRNPVIYPPPIDPLGRVIETQQLVHVVDVKQEPAYLTGFPPIVELVELGGARTLLLVPMLKEKSLVGVIAIFRQKVHAFSGKQIDLVTSFGSQAVIAIENARLLSELRERTDDLSELLQQQTATADVLKVISRSAFDLQTVLDTLVVSAARLCDADRACIFQKKGEEYRWVSNFGFSPELIAYADEHPFTAGTHSTTSRVALEGKPIHNHDVLADPNYRASEYQRLGNYRTMLGIPLLREGAPIGVFILTREQVRPFADRQIELVTSFADQAVIAIENVRLFEEVQARTRELSLSLEDLRTAQDRLVQTEKLASLGQLTAGIAHEIKNPLNFVNNFSSLSGELIDELNELLGSAALDGKTREEIDELTNMLKGNLDKVVQHGKRADSIVKNMLLHSREGSGERRAADINTIVEESLNLAYHGARAEKSDFNITLQRDLDPSAGVVDLYPQEITRVFLNLISNGFYAANKRKEAGDRSFEPLLTATTKNLGSKVEIRIRDNGTGIPAEVKEKMFNPFFTTKPAGEGTGLGLSMSHDIVVKQHGGEIDVETEPGAFTEFIIRLPRAAA